MKESRKNIEKLFETKGSEGVVTQFSQLVNFIDATIAEGFNKDNEEKTQFLLRQILTLRAFLNRTINDNYFKVEMLQKIQDLYAELEENKEQKKEQVTKKNENLDLDNQSEKNQ